MRCLLLDFAAGHRDLLQRLLRFVEHLLVVARAIGVLVVDVALHLRGHIVIRSALLEMSAFTSHCLHTMVLVRNNPCRAKLLAPARPQRYQRYCEKKMKSSE